MYKGALIKESLEDISILDKLRVIETEETNDVDPNDRWHIYTVEVSEGEIEEISKYIKPVKWYAHFWKEREVIAVFRGKTLMFNYDDKDSWKPAVDHGLSVGIPIEQLDFLID